MVIADEVLNDVFEMLRKEFEQGYTDRYDAKTGLLEDLGLYDMYNDYRRRAKMNFEKTEIKRDEMTDEQKMLLRNFPLAFARTFKVVD